MSSDRRPAHTSGTPKLAPMIGSLLRFPHEVVVARLLATLHEGGHDITATELRLFLYPGPEGRRPSELARQCDMSRQAMNYVLSGLVRRGYVERDSAPRASARIVRLTDRGRTLIPLLRRCVADIEEEWVAHLGARRFKALRATLYELAAWLGKLP